MERKHRVLVIAEAANPEWTSVPLVGWSLASALRDAVDAHLVTQVRNRDAIVRAGWEEGIDFTAIDTEALARPMYALSEKIKLGWSGTTAIAAVTYPYFERLVWQKFGQDIMAGKYDVVHRVTPLSQSANSSLAPKCAKAGVPFVVGPLNGGVPWPKGFQRERRRERDWLSYIRWTYRLVPGRRAMLKSASAIITGSQSTLREIPTTHHHKCVHLPENAIDPARFNQTAEQPGTLPLRACFIARMDPCKGTDMLVEAAAPLLKDGRMTLDMIGDGPMMPEVRALVDRLGVADAVTFHGWIDHKTVQDIAAKAHLLTFPSIREFGGGVVLEAMALGVVPVVIDYGGPGELVITGTGFKVAIDDRPVVIAALQNQLEAIAADPTVLPKLGQAAQDRVLTHFTWPAKAKQIIEVYDWVLGHRKNKPDPLAARESV
ncbi:glycosyltransferase family 4 protein [uncultured Tateyamaria sp.]|uniref:glycosyltransferase family 4 protein n=1 Tax=uncultured Tateyamaria sp. TaxID=455651 RepID=UPI00261F178E|nr:glycosyltransferase family 4 protein [uncultured Tateyamaria sp.]